MARNQHADPGQAQGGVHHDRQRDAQRRAKGGRPVQAGAQDQGEIGAGARQCNQVHQAEGNEQTGQHNNSRFNDREPAWRISGGRGL
ncbi:hypothetical protein AERO8C_70116 [Aeromonas veronii]|uniref:Uncharacterized protein n=1 Tax=Aeromonas veronii TaxID=654 RepID=A0A653LA55_AERVE|nr:hypothetical protein AERO8C_70116 [Aeromonas veronii]